MADKTLVAYLHRVKEDGLMEYEVRGILVDAGWQNEDIEAGITEVYHSRSLESVHTPARPQATPVENLSNLEKIRRILLWVIAFRVAVFPIRYFLAPILLNPQTFSRYAMVPFLGNIGALGAVLPLFWFYPALLIYSRKRSGYHLAILFGLLLIYTNVLTVSAIVPSQLFLFLSTFYVITGSVIIVLAWKGLSYFPKAQEEPHSTVRIRESTLPVARIAIGALFAFTDIAPGLLSPGGVLAGAFPSSPTPVGYSWDTVNLFLGGGAAVICGFFLGIVCADTLIQNIRTGKGPRLIGVAQGLMNGAIAQLPLYGFTMLQVIAMPVGALIGSILGLIGVGGIYLILKATIVDQES